MKTFTTVVVCSGLLFASTAQAQVEAPLKAMVNQVMTEELQQLRVEVKQQIIHSVQSSLSQLQLPSLVTAETKSTDTITAQRLLSKTAVETVQLPE